jgi:glycerol-3-phosphate dehydrogenase (NAD(P)+)
MKKAALIGRGEIGLAIGSLLEKNGIDHLFWDKDPERSTGELPDVLSGADAVFFCIPSWALREALSSAKDHLKGDEILVFISKGLESGTGLNAPEMASEIFPDAKIVFLGGPMIAEEVVSGKGGAGVSASRHSDAAEIVRKAISSEGFFVEISEDVGGAAFAGVMKNIYAMVIGASAGVGYGVNVKGLVMRKALFEMGKVIALLGGKEDTAYGLAGLGDLIATSGGPLSSNWSAGFSLAKKEAPKKISEGMSSFAELGRRLGDISKFGVLMAAGDIIAGKDPKSSIDGIINEK